MRKLLFSAMIAVLAFVATGCDKDSHPANVQGTWVHVNVLTGIESNFSISNSSASKGIPATINYLRNGQEYSSTKVLVDYDPSSGEGTFVPETGKAGFAGSFVAFGDETMELDLYMADNDGDTQLFLKNALYVLK